MIPIQNLYYLLSYAWNTLEEAERVAIDAEQYHRLPDLFAKVLINGLKILLKRGLDRDYQPQEQEVAGVKGKLNFSATLKSNRLWQQHTICAFDEYSADMPSNQILAATIQHLLDTPSLDKQLKGELQGIQRMFPRVKAISLSKKIFAQVQLRHNQQMYGFLLHICRIIAENLLPTENPGRFKFVDFRRDERKMNRVFESFLFRFFQKEQNEYWVRREQIRWQWDAPQDPQHLSYLPIMETDLTLESKSRKIIIDAKYYRSPLGGSRFDADKLVSANLYQLYSYLLNQSHRDERSRVATGMLLYPQIDAPLRLDYRFGEHLLLVRSINLNANWRDIHQNLLELL